MSTLDCGGVTRSPRRAVARLVRRAAALAGPPLVLCLVLAGTVLSASPAFSQDDEPAAVTWGVSPSSQYGPDGRPAFDYRLDPGDTLIDFVAVSNFSAEPITVQVYASDAFTTEDGGFDLLPSDIEPVDVGSWVGFNEEQLTIDPDTRIDVPFAVTVPDNATPGDHVGGIVAAIAEDATDAEGGGFMVERRVGARIHLRVNGEMDPVLEPTIRNPTYHASMNPFGAGSATFDYTVVNTGNVRLQGTVIAHVSGPWGLLPREVEVAELGQILPGDSFAGDAEVPSVWPLGPLTVQLTVRPEATSDLDDELELRDAADEVTVWGLPWLQALILLAVALTVYVAVKLRKRKKAKNAGAKEPVKEREEQQQRQQEQQDARTEGPGTRGRNEK